MMLGRAERKRRQLAAIASLAGDVGYGIGALKRRQSDTEKEQLEERTLAARLHEQTVDAKESAKSQREREAALAKTTETTGLDPDLQTPLFQSPNEQRGRLAELATGRVGAGLRRLLLGDPLRGARQQHIAEMKGEGARLGDVRKNLTAAGPAMKYSTDPGAIVRGVGGGELGIPTTGIRPATAKRAESYQALDVAAATAEAIEESGQDPPPVGLVTAKIDARRRSREQQKLRDQREIKGTGGKSGTKYTTKYYHDFDAEPGEQPDLPIPGSGDMALSIQTDREIKARQARGHRVLPVTRAGPDLPGGEGGGGGGGGPAVTSSPFLDDESGITFGHVGP
jgi:hypothetical protein